MRNRTDRNMAAYRLSLSPSKDSRRGDENQLKSVITAQPAPARRLSFQRSLYGVRLFSVVISNPILTDEDAYPARSFL